MSHADRTDLIPVAGPGDDDLMRAELRHNGRVMLLHVGYDPDGRAYVVHLPDGAGYIHLTSELLGFTP